MRALLLVLSLLLAAPAAAGPWPRAEGESYAFAGHEGGRDGWTGVYAEHGLPRALTLGLDLGGHAGGLMLGDPTMPLDGRARAFLRVPVLSDPGRRAARAPWAAPWLAAVEVALGADLEEDGDASLRYGAGLAVGRPLETRLGPGWTTLDLRAMLGGGRRARLNAGGVVGIRPTGRLAVEMALFAEREGATSWTLAPTLQYGFGRLGAARVGLSLKDDGRALLRLGWARRF